MLPRKQLQRRTTYGGSGTASFHARFNRTTSYLIGVIFFADKISVRVGRTLRGRAAADGRVALGKGIPKRGILTRTKM